LHRTLGRRKLNLGIRHNVPDAWDSPQLAFRRSIHGARYHSGKFELLLNLHPRFPKTLYRLVKSFPLGLNGYVEAWHT